MKTIFIILLLSIIITVLFIPRYPIEHYSQPVNDWGGVPHTEEDYKRLEKEFQEQRELLRKKDDLVQEKVKECKKENETVENTLTKRMNELEKSENEATAKKNECEMKSVTCIKDVADATAKVTKLENELIAVKASCDSQKATNPTVPSAK